MTEAMAVVQRHQVLGLEEGVVVLGALHHLVTVAEVVLGDLNSRALVVGGVVREDQNSLALAAVEVEEARELQWEVEGVAGEAQGRCSREGEVEELREHGLPVEEEEVVVVHDSEKAEEAEAVVVR